MAGTRDLYSASAAKAWQAQLADVWLPAVIYIRPPFYAAMLKAAGRAAVSTRMRAFSRGLNLAALVAVAARALEPSATRGSLSLGRDLNPGG